MTNENPAAELPINSGYVSIYQSPSTGKASNESTVLEYARLLNRNEKESYDFVL